MDSSFNRVGWVSHATTICLAAGDGSKTQTTPFMKYFLHMYTYFKTLQCAKEGVAPKCAKLWPSGTRSNEHAVERYKPAEC